MAKVKVIVSKDGEVTVDVNGVVGRDCEKLTRELEKKLGLVKKRTKKREYYRQAQKHKGQRNEL